MLFCKTQCLLVRACQLPPDFLPVNAISTCMSGISMHWSLFGNWSTTVDLLALSRPTSLYSVTWMTLKLSTSSMCILSGKCRDFCWFLLYSAVFLLFVHFRLQTWTSELQTSAVSDFPEICCEDRNILKKNISKHERWKIQHDDITL